jgi:hypothetical protein
MSEETYTFTQEEMLAIREAFNKLYRIADGGAASIEDYFPNQKTYLDFERTRARIDGRRFRLSDYQ